MCTLDCCSVLSQRPPYRTDQHVDQLIQRTAVDTRPCSCVEAGQPDSHGLVRVLRLASLAPTALLSTDKDRPAGSSQSKLAPLSQNDRRSARNPCPSHSCSGRRLSALHVQIFCASAVQLLPSTAPESTRDPSIQTRLMHHQKTDNSHPNQLHTKCFHPVSGAS